MDDDNMDKSLTPVFTINDFGRICRMCLIDLNLDNVAHMTIDDVCDLLDYLAQMKIECSDRLPQNICIGCIEELHRSCEFKRLILKNDVILKKSLREVDDPADEKDDIEIDIHHYLVDNNEPSASCITNENASENNVFSENGNNLTGRLTKEHIYSCSHCGNGFTERDRLTQHEKTHEKTEDIDKIEKAGGFTCNICGSDFQRATSLRTHMKRHTEEPSPVEECHVDDAFPCVKPDQICSKSCKTDVSLTNHQTIHKTKNHVCSNFGKGFATEKALEGHSRTYTAEKPSYECNDCGRLFSRKDKLKAHTKQKQMHSEERRYKCKICPKTFRRPYNLARHTMIHTGEKPYECNDCGKKCSQKETLKVHLRTHMVEKPYECDDCGKRFSSKTNLINHIRTHTGDKPFSCTVCKSSFSQSSSLTNHLRVHSNERPYKCKICPKSFTRSHHLTRHTMTHTGEKPYECYECGKKCSQKETLKVHLRTHTGEKPYKCKICPKTFISHQRTRHTMMHTGERSYECNVCAKRFSRKDKLKMHLRTHSRGQKPSSCTESDLTL